MTNHTLAFFQQLGPWEMGIILLVALLLFGRRLPEVGRSLGRGIVEFKKGVKGIEDEIESESNQPKDTQASTGKSHPAELPESDPRRVSQGSSTAPQAVEPPAQATPEQAN